MPPTCIALVGNPNCGKTALFNLLTGARQKVANYAGVTVERKLGTATLPVYFALVQPSSPALVAYGLVMAAFVAYTHRANLQRMRAGNENRARRLWLLRPR